ncbi:MAG: flagellin [Thermoguttaceae bacterium]
MSIVPLGFGRVSVPMQFTRATSSLQYQNSAMAKYEQQLTTNLRYQYGSDAPFDAATTLSVQMQMERKEQNVKNTSSALSFLSATESSVSQINKLLSDARGAALDAVNTTTSNAQRVSLAMTVQQTLAQVFNLGNSKHNDRYLFSGATTSQIPFVWGSDSYTIDYLGSQTELFTWSNVDLLAQSTVNGNDIFGAISDPVRGDSDLNPSLRYDIPLSELNGGDGVTLGSIRLTFTRNGIGTATDVNLAGCVTVRDVCDRITKASPPGLSIRVERTNSGLAITIPDDAAATLTISEVGRETVAKQLGIATTTPIRPGETFIGKDLNPIVSPQTPLADLFGSRAIASLKFAGDNNDIVIEANSNGASFNGTTLALVGDRNVPPGHEQVSYNAATGQITLVMHPDHTSANDMVAAINRASEDGTIPSITARLDPLDQQRRNDQQPGTGLVPILPGTPIVVGKMQYGSGEPFDQKSGMQIVNGGKTHTLDFSKCTSVGDFLSVLNDPQYGLFASINPSGTGVNIQSRVSGADFTIGENGGTTATQLGVRTLVGSTVLSDLDFGRGVHDYEGPGTNASVVYTSQIANTAMRLTAREEGVAWNDVAIEFVTTNDPDGRVLVTWDEASKRITVAINPGVTKACDVVAAFNEQPGPREFFTLALDDTNGVNTGQGVIDLGNKLTSGGSDGGVDFTITRNDGTKLDINILGAKTIDDVLAIINNNPKNGDGLLVAQLSEFGNGIELVDKSLGGFATRVDRALLSTVAYELGLVPWGEEYQTKTTSGAVASAMFAGANVNTAIYASASSVSSLPNGIRIEYVDMNAAGGTGQPSFAWDAAQRVMRFEIDSGTTTARDVLALYEAEATPQLKSLFRFQNGSNPDGTTSDGSGVVSLGMWQLAGGGDAKLTGTDPNPLETESLYTALVRLQRGMERNDIREIERATQMLDARMSQLTNVRAEVGVRQQALDTNTTRIEDESIQLQETLKNAHEINFADTSMEYLAQQTMYQAALTVTGRIFQMSLMNYL